MISLVDAHVALIVYVSTQWTPWMWWCKEGCRAIFEWCSWSSQDHQVRGTELSWHDGWGSSEAKDLCFATISKPLASDRKHDQSQLLYSSCIVQCWNIPERIWVMRRKTSKSIRRRFPDRCYWWICFFLRRQLNASKWFVVGMTPLIGTFRILDAWIQTYRDQLCHRDTGSHVSRK